MKNLKTRFTITNAVIGVNKQQDLMNDFSGKKVLKTALTFFCLLICSTLSTQKVFAAEDQNHSRAGFVKNMGQLLSTDNHVTQAPLYYSKAGLEDYYLLNDRIAYSFFSYNSETKISTAYRMDMRFPNINTQVEITNHNKLFYNNYYLSHTGGGLTDVGVYESVQYNNIFDGINLSCTIGDALGFDYMINPNALADLSFYFDGATSTTVSEQNVITIECPAGSLTFDAPVASQDINGQITSVSVSKQFNNVQFLNSLGQVVKSLNYCSASIKVNDLAPGLYFLRFQDMEGVEYTQHIVLQ